MVVMAGAASDAAEIAKGKAFERAGELDTSTFTVPAEARSEAGMTAVSCVEPTKVVASADVTAGADCVAGMVQSTREPFTKFEPFTVRVTADGLHDGVVFDVVVEEDKEAIVGGTMVNASEEEAVPPGLIAAT
jgi:hypothetical protein